MAIDERTLRTIVEQEIRTATGFIGGDVSEDRRRAMDYYLGDPFGNEQEGRSQVVSTDVQDVIESVMPDFMEMFFAGDEVVRFKPDGPEDEEVADQATDYINYIWRSDNDGFGNTHDWIKDALLQKNGLIKVYWDDSEDTKQETLENVTSLQLQELTDDSEVEITAHTENQVQDPQILPFAPDGVLHDVTLRRTVTKGRAKVESLPPEEFLIARRSVSLEDAEFTCHKTRKTVSDLLEMGYDPEVIESIPSHDDQDYNEERVSRFDDDEWPTIDDTLDKSMREIWLYQCYLLVDFDEDGIAEMRQVTVAGPGYEILENEEVDDHPFASLTPIRMPHKFFGRSVADLVMDIQLIKSTIQRQLLDNMYLVNNGRTAISNKVDLDDYLTNRPGGAIRVDTDTPDAAGHIQPVQTQPLGNHAYPLLEYMDGIRETRTGVTRLNQGLDPDSLNKTATGINQLLGRTQRRMLLIARVFAETGFKMAFRKLLNLVVTHQDRERVIRLRNQWIPMNPKAWNAEMDLSVHVGLGHGTKQDEIMMMRLVLEVQERIFGAQMKIGGPHLVDHKTIYNTLKRWTNAMGIKDAEAHWNDPEDPQHQGRQGQRPPDPKMLEAQMKGQEAQGKQQLEMAKLQQEAQQFQRELMKEQQQFQQELEFKYRELEAKFGIDREKVGLERDKAAAEIGIKQDERQIARAEFEGSPLGENLSRVQQAEEMSKAAIARLAEQEGRNGVPKVVKLRRDKKGKITGGEVQQGDTTTEIQLER